MKIKHDLKKILKDAGLKNTVPRNLVLKSFLEIKKPATAQELYKKFKKKEIDLVTLYRTIDAFEKSGLIRRIDLRKDAVHYELNTDHHHHIVCTNCDKMEDFENREVEKILEKIAKKSANFGEIKNHSLELFGFCKDCRLIL